MDTPVSVEGLVNQPAQTFKIETALGSTFFMCYRPTMLIRQGDAEFENGDIALQGYSVLAAKDVHIAGIGFRPEEGGRLAVKPVPEDTDVDPAEYSELITFVKEIVDD